MKVFLMKTGIVVAILASLWFLAQRDYIGWWETQFSGGLALKANKLSGHVFAHTRYDPYQWGIGRRIL